jgi:hypothetical protein
METLKDCDGKTSSKRIAGFASLIFLMGLTVLCWLKTPSYIPDFLWTWVPIILVLFGATSIEKFANLRSTRKRTESSAFPPYSSLPMDPKERQRFITETDPEDKGRFVDELSEEEELLKKGFVKKVPNPL